MISSRVVKVAVAVLALGSVVGLGAVNAGPSHHRVSVADSGSTAPVVPGTPGPTPAPTLADVTWGR
ncbi:hypothetical protein BX265_0206 [Streptomyces sp. TLI_235]|nr:hypothetical protein BX265_0206 [Streptomyces sp. TLI_235]